MRSILKTIVTSYFILCAKIYLARHKPIIIGVTGSVGKTTCRGVITETLRSISQEKKIYSSSQNFNSELGLPLSMLCFEKSSLSVGFLSQQMLQAMMKSLFGKSMYDVIIAEYGIDEPGDMQKLISIARPDYSILTKLDYVHVANFPDGEQQLWAEKWLLLQAAKSFSWYNGVDEYSIHASKELKNSSKAIFTQHLQGKISISNNSIGEDFESHGMNISSNIAGEEYKQYVSVALDLALRLEMKLPSEVDLQLELQPGRMSVFDHDGNIFIDSSYNGGPQSMRLLIEKCSQLQSTSHGGHGLILCLGDMRELGEKSESCHRELAKNLPLCDMLYCVGSDMKSYLIPECLKKDTQTQYHSSMSSREIGQLLQIYLQNTDKKYIILIKGGQNTIYMEEVFMQVLPEDMWKSLPRQSKSWKKHKDEFFQKIGGDL